MERAAAILNRAAELIEKDGWIQGNWREHGARCAGQAIYDALPYRMDFSASDSAWVAMRRQIGKQRGDTMFEIAHWNDAPGRTKDEVIATLKRAASSLSKSSSQPVGGEEGE